MAGRKLRRGVSIVGSAVSRFGAFPDKSSRDLMADAYSEAVESVDKGFDPEDIEALYIGNFTADLFEGQSHLGHVIADHLGLTPRPATRVEGACASSSLAFRQGVMAIASGLHDVVMVGGVEKMTDASAAEVQSHLAVAGDVAMEVDQAGFTFPAFYAAMASAYMARYGATHEHFMHVAIKNHENGALNPKAQFNESLRDTMGRRVKRAAERGEPAPGVARRDRLPQRRQGQPDGRVAAAPVRLLPGDRRRVLHAARRRRGRRQFHRPPGVRRRQLAGERGPVRRLGRRHHLAPGGERGGQGRLRHGRRFSPTTSTSPRYTIASRLPRFSRSRTWASSRPARARSRPPRA